MLGLGRMSLAVVVPMMVVMSVPGVLVVVRRPMIMPVVLAISLVLMVGEGGGRHGAGRCGRQGGGEPGPLGVLRLIGIGRGARAIAEGLEPPAALRLTTLGRGVA